uniref:Uncharacterized protein n=1 Tax=Clastoptera arizonana TaxID=38151 RepID=A0A1B6EG63_9HEMI
MPMILRKEVGTQTIEYFPDIHSFGNITCKMVETIDKNGVKKNYPHIIMEAFPRIESQNVSKKTIHLKNVTQNPMSSAKDNISNTSIKKPPPKSHKNLATNKQLKNIVNTENHDKLNKKVTHFNGKNEYSKKKEKTLLVSTNCPRDNKLSYKSDHSMPKKRSCSTDTTMSENNFNVMSNKRGVCVDVAVPETNYILKNKLLDNLVTKESICKDSIVSETSRIISNKKESHINKSESKKRIITGNSPIPKKRGRPPGCKNKVKPDSLSVTEKINTYKGNINSDLNKSQSDSISKKDLASSNNFHNITLNLQTEENNEDNLNVKEKEEFFCSACKENFTDVVEHLKNYHPNHEVELESDVYQNYKDKLDVTNKEEGSKEDKNRYTVTLNTNTQKDKKKLNSNAGNKRKAVSSDNDKQKHKRESNSSNVLEEKKSDEHSNKNNVKKTTFKSYIQSYEKHLKDSRILPALSNCKVVLEKLNYNYYKNNIVKLMSEGERNMNTSVLESNEILTHDEKIVIPNSNNNETKIQGKTLQEKCAEEKKRQRETVNNR